MSSDSAAKWNTGFLEYVINKAPDLAPFLAGRIHFIPQSDGSIKPGFMEYDDIHPEHIHNAAIWKLMEDYYASNPL